MNKSEIAEREKFEKFIQGRFRSIEKHLGRTTYRWTDVQLAWEAWERRALDDDPVEAMERLIGIDPPKTKKAEGETK